MFLLVLYVAISIGVSFLCSVLEAVLLSVTPSFIAAKEQEDQEVGERLRRLKEDVDRPLAAILSLNTVAHTVGAAGAGAQAAVVFGDAAVGVFSGVLTLLILVISEIIPKTLGASHWRRLAGPTARVLPVLIALMWPLVKLAQWIAGVLSRGPEEAAISRQEIEAMANVGQEEGVVDERESRILRNLLRLDVLTVADVMTPRTVSFALPESLSVREMVERHEELRFSRIPVYDQNIDEITGFVLKTDVLLKAAHGELDLPLVELRRDVLVVREETSLHDFFERLLDENKHIALVVDEYGGTAGLATLEDVVETLLGLEIVDEADATRDLQAYARQKWKERARRLGIWTEDGPPPPARAGEDEGEDRRAQQVARYGITGGATP